MYPGSALLGSSDFHGHNDNLSFVALCPRERDVQARFAEKPSKWLKQLSTNQKEKK